MRKSLTVLALVASLVAFAACSSSGKASAGNSEKKVQTDSYKNLVAAEPAHGMTYSPTRATINKWIDTWNVKGQLAFLYLTDTGKLTGYYVLNGPPVSMCAGITQPWEFVNNPGADADNSEPAPGVDGVWYSGGQCNQYYGIDASTNAYVEFSIGGNQNYELTTQPLPHTGDLPANAFTDVTDVHKQGDIYVVNKLP